MAETVVHLLQELQLTTMAQVCTSLAVTAAKEGLSHDAYLQELARLEVEARTQRRIERHLGESGLPREKTFATFQEATWPLPQRLALERLRSGAFVQEAANVIAIGPPGVGKSHALAALGQELVYQGHTVRWTSTATLVQRLLAAKRDFHLPAEVAKLHRISCLILDDIGYVQHSREEMEVLFTVLADRYEQRSVLITTNLVFSQWDTIFKDPMTTMAAIDRLVHHAVILDLSGVSSYRIAQAQKEVAKS